MSAQTEFLKARLAHDERVALDVRNDRGWWNEPRGWRDVIRCLAGRHRVITSGFFDGMFVSRCSCGAIRIGRRRWFEAKPFTRRGHE